MNETGRQSQPETPVMRIRSVDGTVYSIATSPADYVLHPAFLKFIVAACMLYGLLDQNKELSRLTGWLIWGQVVAVILLWLVIGGNIVRQLARRGVIRLVWTPVLLLPLVLLLEAMVQTTYFFTGLPPKPWGTTVADLARVMAIILLFDFLHGQYVVARHPYARLQTPLLGADGEWPKPAPEAPAPSEWPGTANPPMVRDETSAIAQPPAPSVSADVEVPAMSRLGSVRIGSETFALSDILMIRIEDHYLSVATRTGRSLQRAKLAAIQELHQGDLGIQINRSVWVAFRAIHEVQATKNGQILLVLVNGDEEFVAKPRVHAFRQTYRLSTGEAVPSGT